MVTGTHPEDVDLFDYVEGDLPHGQRAELEAHLGSCARCAEQLALLQVGRDALRESQSLQLPRQAREAILLNLPDRRRETRRPSLSFRHVLAALIPVAAVAAVVIGLVNISGNNRDESAAVGAEATRSAPMVTDASGGGEAAEESDRASKRRLLFLGPPADVAAELQAKGFQAQAVGDRVEVRNATRAEIRRALQGRRDGSVRIVIVP